MHGMLALPADGSHHTSENGSRAGLQGQESLLSFQMVKADTSGFFLRYSTLTSLYLFHPKNGSKPPLLQLSTTRVPHMKGSKGSLNGQGLTEWRLSTMTRHSKPLHSATEVCLSTRTLPHLIPHVLLWGSSDTVKQRTKSGSSVKSSQCS